MAGRTAIGLDIGTSVVRAVELSFGRAGLTLERFGQVVLPEGVVRDGEVVDTDAVAACLRQLWSATGFSHKRVVLGVANQRVIVRQLELPWMPKDDLRAGLAFQVQDFLPMPTEQAVLDFFPLEERSQAGGERTLNGLLVAAARDTVLANVRCAERAGLSVTAVDLTSFAVLRALGKQIGMLVETEALIDVGARITNVVVHSGGVPRFVRILLMGGQDVTDAVADRLRISSGEAEALKQQVASGVVRGRLHGRHPRCGEHRPGLRRGDPGLAGLLRRLQPGCPGGADPDLRRWIPAGRPAGQALGRDPAAGAARRPAGGSAHRSHRPGRRPARVRQAAGRRAGGPGVGSDVMTAQPEVQASPQGGTVARVDWAPVPRVNLLPPEILAARGFRTVQIRLALLVVTTFLVAGGGVVWAQLRVAGARAALDATTAQTAVLHRQEATYAEVPRVGQQVTEAKAVRELALGQDVLWYRLLSDVALATPSTVWLTTLNASLSGSPSTAGAAGAAGKGGPSSDPLTPTGIGTVLVTGSAAGYPDVAAWLDSIVRVSGLDGSTLQTATRQNAPSAGPGGKLQFTSGVVLTGTALSHRFDRKAG